MEGKTRTQSVSSGGLRILVVEDRADVAAGLAMLLELHDHQVRIASDGPAAVAVAQDFRPELVLLDIALPGIDGYEVAHRLRAQLAGDPVHFIALTGRGSIRDQRLSREAGFDHHLLKPLEPQKLLELIDTYRNRT